MSHCLGVAGGHIYEALANLRPRQSFVRQTLNNGVYGGRTIDLRGRKSCESFVNMASWPPGLHPDKFRSIRIRPKKAWVIPRKCS
jgi:hypothetical protein